MLHQEDMQDKNLANQEKLLDKKAASLARTRATDFSKTEAGMRLAHDLKMNEQAAAAYRSIDESFDSQIAAIRNSADLMPEDKEVQIAALNKSRDAQIERYQKRYAGNQGTSGHIEKPVDPHSGMFATADEYLQFARENSPGASDDQLIKYAKDRGISIKDWGRFADQPEESTANALPTGRPGGAGMESMASGHSQDKPTIQHKPSGQMARRNRRGQQKPAMSESDKELNDLLNKRKELATVLKNSRSNVTKSNARKKLKAITQKLADLGYDKHGNQIAMN